MRKGRWISLGLTVGVGLVLGLNSGWVSAQEQQEGSGEVQERGIIGEFPHKPPPSVDLVPIIPTRLGHFCPNSASGQLLVPIANVGTVGAPATILKVDIYQLKGTSRTVRVNVPPINPYSVTIVAVAVDCPTPCGAQFTMTVDASGAVTETSWPEDPEWGEGNNLFINARSP